MCAIFGLIDYNHTLNAKQREKLLRVLSEECEERGTDATGYAFNHNGKLFAKNSACPLFVRYSDFLCLQLSFIKKFECAVHSLGYSRLCVLELMRVNVQGGSRV